MASDDCVHEDKISEEQGRERPPQKNPFRISPRRLAGIKVSYESWLLTIICIFDLWLTVFLLRSGLATEANPVLRVYLEAGLASFIAGKMLLSVAPLIVLEILRLHRPRFIQAVERAAIVLYVLCYIGAGWQVNFVH